MRKDTWQDCYVELGSATFFNFNPTFSSLLLVYLYDIHNIQGNVDVDAEEAVAKPNNLLSGVNV